MAGFTERTRIGRQRSLRPRRAARTLAGAILAALALTACGGDGGVSVPTLPTERPTLPTLPTLPALPTPTLPTLPALPTPTLPTLPPLPTLPTAAPDATAEPTETPTTAPPPVEEEEDDVEATDAEDAEAEEGGSGWLWLLLLVLVVAGVAAAAVLLRRRRERAAWSDAVEEPLQEAIWLRDTIVPNLLAQGPDGRAGIWAIGRQRVLTLEQRLADLVAQAPDPATARRVAALSAAVQALRRTLDQADTLVDFGGTRTVAALQQSQHELDEAIRALQPPPEEGIEEPPGSPRPDGRA